MAMEEIESGKISAPDRMVVSLPPLGTADAAFAIRERFGGEVILDYMDAWPETFYRVLPGWVPQAVKTFFFRPFLKTAERACRGADRISAVAQVYIDLAKARAPDTPMHLCYHGIDINRDEGDKWDSPKSCSSPSSLLDPPLKIAYIGALERSYDLKTAIRAVHEINTQGHRVELHIAGAGTCEESLKAFAQSLSSPGSSANAVQPGATSGEPQKKIPALSHLSHLSRECGDSSLFIQFHGNLNRDDLRSFLASCLLGLIPMKQDSWVGLPYKVADYCAAGLPVVSSLDGECRQLLDTKNAGSFYEPGNMRQLVESIKSYLEHNAKLVDQANNAKGIATGLFDRKQSYQELAAFIENS
jgi:glycosyltransferase involved in cell wall biosynthesis